MSLAGRDRSDEVAELFAELQGSPTPLTIGATVHQDKPEARREWARGARAERIAAGLCVLCGKYPAVMGTRRCEPCRQLRRADNILPKMRAHVERDDLLAVVLHSVWEWIEASGDDPAECEALLEAMSIVRDECPFHPAWKGDDDAQACTYCRSVCGS